MPIFLDIRCAFTVEFILDLKIFVIIKLNPI